jgi:ABC-type transport system involved in multi-copper enzyme maturation permease subunit
MTPDGRRVFRALARESLADAVRRRLVLVIAAASLLSLQALESCTSCGSATLTRDGETIPLSDVAGIGAVLLAVACALWTYLLAGALASDHLAEPLEDGSAALVLARPVGRGRFALARLCGVLVVALASGALLLFATAGLLYARQGLAWPPAAEAFGACALGAVTVGALAMAASLVLPRLATLLLVAMGVGAVAIANVASLLGAELGTLGMALDRFGPPLVSAVAFGVREWLAPTELPGSAVALVLRLSVWALASAALLVHAFRRAELR